MVRRRRDAHVITLAHAEVKARLKEAGNILHRCLRPKELGQLAGGMGSMPQARHEPGEFEAALAKATEVLRVRPARPGPAEIDRLDECLRWVLWLGPAERPVVFGCMVASLRKVAANDPGRRSHMSIKNIQDRGISHILARLIEKNATF